MRHRKSGHKLGRNTAHLRALFRNMSASLLLHGRIETTLAKAKELRGYAEPLITKAIRLRRILPSGQRKPSDEVRDLALHMRRLIGERLPPGATMKGEDGDRFLSRRDLVAYLVDDVAPRFLKRPGGYTRIRRLGFRKGDNAPLVILELMPGEAAREEEKPKGEATKKKRASFFRRGKAEAAAEDEKRERKAVPAEQPPKKAAKRAEPEAPAPKKPPRKAAKRSS
jgi:large subunit ribosomal protein L17